MSFALPGHRVRLIIMACLFGLIFAVLIWRIFDLMVFNRDFLLNQGEARSIRTTHLPASRGMIVDRMGMPLAISTPIHTAWINPKIFEASSDQIRQLAYFLHTTPSRLTSKINASKHRQFLYLKRQLPPEIFQKISALNITGLFFQQEYKRYYPIGESAAPLLGFTNIDDKGIEGLELAYDNWLSGSSGKKRVVKDRLGRVVEELDVLEQPKHGQPLRLSIDRRIQYFAYEQLQKILQKYGAKAGSVVVLDVSGELLAVANAPTFNPNARSGYLPENFRNRAFTDMFEPGSVIKPFSVSSALSSGKFTTQSLIDTRPSWMMVHGQAIRDMRDYGILDITQILQHSSNVGVTKLVLANHPENLIDLYYRVGFSQRTDSAFPGESSGSLVSVRDANPFVLATLGFGYGLSVTAVQLAKSYSVFANHGKLRPIYLLRQENNVDGEQVIESKIADDVLAMLESVLDKDGTGKQARVPGFRVAGKTGTSRIAGKHGYEANRHIATFVGVAPVSKPRVIVAVVIHEPTKISYYGGAVAAPLFSQVMATTLRLLDVTPDEDTRKV